jgi:sulfur relay (sulfurtransferase) complex TusBCD TusD component (DsrE family)
MTSSKNSLLAALVAVSLITGPAAAVLAGDADPLFINLTSDDGHRINMAFSFGGKQHERGHPLTIFMNDRAVMAASKANAVRFPEQQKAIADLLANGATIIVCPMCMEHYGVTEDDLLAGLTVGNPEATGGALFQDNAKTLTW